MTQHDQHDHEWRRVDGGQGTRAWQCAQCPETCATCGTCGGPTATSLLLCQRCEREARRVLDGITAALDQYRPDPRSPMSSPGDMRLVPGGGTRGGITTPGDVHERLWGWVARWTEHTGPSNAAAVEYLADHHVWAAHNPEASDWAAYLVDMRRLRHAARRIAGLLPQRLPEPCVHCGGECVQDWADRSWQALEDGLSDVVRCTRCGMTWGDRTLWRFVTRRRIVEIPGEHPDSLVTMEHARRIWPDVPAATFRDWARRWREDGPDRLERVLLWWATWCMWRAGERPWWAEPGWRGPGEPPSLEGWLPERGERDGRALYRVGDLQALVERWADRQRTGRPSVSSGRIGA